MEPELSQTRNGGLCLNISGLIQKTGIRLGQVIITIILLLTILTSSIFILFCVWFFGANGYSYEDLYTEKAPNGEFELKIQKTQMLAGISNESYFCKILLIDHNEIIAEYEGGCLPLDGQQYVHDIEWDTQNSRVTVVLYYEYADLEQRITLDYSAKHNTRSVNYFDGIPLITKTLLYSGLIFLLSVLILEIFISALYRSYCRKKYIEQPQPENSEQPDRESKA